MVSWENERVMNLLISTWKTCLPVLSFKYYQVGYTSKKKVKWCGVTVAENGGWIFFSWCRFAAQPNGIFSCNSTLSFYKQQQNLLTYSFSFSRALLTSHKGCFQIPGIWQRFWSFPTSYLMQGLCHLCREDRERQPKSVGQGALFPALPLTCCEVKWGSWSACTCAFPPYPALYMLCI